MFYEYDDDNINETVENETVPEEAGPEPEPEHIVTETEHEDINVSAEPEKTEEPAPGYESQSSEEGGMTWSEPVYEAEDGKQTNFYTPSYHAPTPEKRQKPKRKHTFLKAACLVLACVLLSSAACYGIVNYTIDKKLATVKEESRVVLNTQSREEKSGDSGSSSTVAYTGKEMTGNEIYMMGCQQVVGVNVSVNTTNIFGQKTSAAVSGSGFIISDDGYILTNYHVISYAELYGGELTVMLYDGTRVPAKIIGYSVDNDVAVIKIDKTGLNAVTLGDSDGMTVGESVYVIGNPLGELAYSMSNGIVSALDRIITTTDETTGEKQSINMFQTTAAVNSGNSGGPVYNEYGEVIGIVTAKYSDSGVEGLGFAIPINDALKIATQLIEKGYISGGAYLGIEVANIDEVYSSFTIQYYNYPKGVYVMSVTADSCAEKGGMKVGDIITKVGDTEITSKSELKLALKKYSPDDTGTITVYRSGDNLGQGNYVDLTVVFDENTLQGTSQDQQQEQPQSGEINPFGGRFPFIPNN